MGNIFSLVGSIYLLLSVFSTKKDKLMHYQILDVLMHMVANVVLGGYGGFIILIFSLIRNILVKYEKNSEVTGVLLVLLTTVSVIYLAGDDKYWYLALIANLVYTAPLSFRKITVKQIKQAMIVNLSLWAVYDLLIKQYPSAVTDIVLIVFTFREIAKERACREKDILK